MPNLVTDNDIRRIRRVHGLEQVRSIQRPTSGVRDHVVYVKQDLPARFNTLDVADSKFRSDAIALTMLADENIRQHQGEISGLIDFEWALSGDPSYDFTNADVREAMIPGSEALLIEGYQSIRDLDEEHDRRVGRYRLFFAPEDAVDQPRQRQPERAWQALAVYRNDFKQSDSSALLTARNRLGHKRTVFGDSHAK